MTPKMKNNLGYHYVLTGNSPLALNNLSNLAANISARAS